jgi:small-conductance mechanosensitive channel
MNALSKETIEYLTKTSISSLSILAGALVIRVLIGIGINKLLKRLEDDDPDTTSELEQRSLTLASLGKNIANVLVYGIALIMVIAEWGINIAPILTGAGIVGLAVGFGTQSLVKDIVTGFFILLENQYNVGDKISVGGSGGVVKELRLRTTVLKGNDGRIYMIPNSNIGMITKNKWAK